MSSSILARPRLHESLTQFLEQVARRGSWFGGGSVAALGAALAAALLEKLVHHPQRARRLRAIRRQCLGLIQQDAHTFARAIRATRANNRRAFQRSLKTATEVPCRVFEHAQTIQAACRLEQRAVKPQFQSDLRSAMAFALAAGESARTLILTNLAWLNDSAYTRQVRRRLQTAASKHAH